MKKEISDRVRKTGRAKLSDNAVLNRLKSEYSIEVNQSVKKSTKKKNIKNIDKDSLQNILLTINQKKITLNVFMSYVLTKKKSSYGCFV